MNNNIALHALQEHIAQQILVLWKLLALLGIIAYQEVQTHKYALEAHILQPLIQLLLPTVLFVIVGHIAPMME